jgi:hypothetical protein
MDDHTMPPSTPLPLIRCCETSRLHSQLLARAYQQVCPEIRRSLQESHAREPAPDRAGGSTTAARLAAGA